MIFTKHIKFKNTFYGTGCVVKKIAVLLFAVFIHLPGQANAQEANKEYRTTPVFAVKSNLLHDAATSMDLGAEFKIGQRLTLDIPVTYNPWTFDDNRKFKHVLVQPELRLWTREPFSGHFFGLHGHYAVYNVIGYGSQHMKDYRHEGWLAGAGISWGYQFYIAPRWNLGFNIGLGYAYMDYEDWDPGQCGDFRKKDTEHYFGPTRAGVSLIFFIK